MASVVCCTERAAGQFAAGVKAAWGDIDDLPLTHLLIGQSCDPDTAAFATAAASLLEAPLTEVDAAIASAFVIGVPGR